MTNTIDKTSTDGAVTAPIASADASTRDPAGPARIEDMAVALMERARADGVSLVGPGGLLQGLAKGVIESALEAELDEHLGYGPYDPAGHHSGNSRNGTRSKTVLTDIGPIDLDVPRDRAGTFCPVIVPKRKRRLGGWTSWCALCRPRASPTARSAPTWPRCTGRRSPRRR